MQSKYDWCHYIHEESEAKKKVSNLHNVSNLPITELES